MILSYNLRELYISDVRNQLYRMRDPLENILKKLVNTKFCNIPNLVIMDNFILNEQTVDYYLCNYFLQI